MSYSEVGICNIALATIGEAAIRDFDEDNKRARMCQTLYRATRDYILTKFDWPFARSNAVLNQVTVAEGSLPDGVCAYQLPNDCKTPRSLYPYGSRQRWEISGDKLITNCNREVGTVRLYYTAQEINVTLFSDTFANLLALGLATRLAPVLTQDKQLTRTIYDQYNAEQRECWESDANIGNGYREYDENPNADTFVDPDLTHLLATEPRVIT